MREGGAGRGRVEEGVVVVTTAKQCMKDTPTDPTHPCQCCALRGRARGSVTECTRNPPHRSSSRDSQHRTLTLGGEEGGVIYTFITGGVVKFRFRWWA